MEGTFLVVALMKIINFKSKTPLRDRTVCADDTCHLLLVLSLFGDRMKSL